MSIGIRQFTTTRGTQLDFTLLGLGTAPLGNFLVAYTEEECDRCIGRSWDLGLRYYDTAPLYGLGLSENRVGRILRGKNRSDYLISTKVGRLLEPCEAHESNAGIFVNTPQRRFVYDYSYDGVMRSFEASLERLGLERVDILFVHDVDGPNHGGREGSEARIRELMELGGWRALAELRSAGVVAAIGAGVNEWQPCARLLELADPDIFLLAGRYTLLEQEPLEKLFPQCAARGTAIVIGGPYNSGVLAGKSTFNYGDIPPSVAKRVQALAGICRQYDVKLRQAALRFVAAHPLVVSVIPGAVSAEEVDDNIASLNASIPSDFWLELKRRDLLQPDAPVPSG